MAKTMADKVKALAEELGSVPVTISTGGTSTLRGTSVRPPTSRTPMTPTPAIRTPLPTMPTIPTAATKPSVYLDADERTNRIFMVGLEEQLVVVDELIDALDVEQQDLRTLKLYKIEHIEAAEARKKLEELGIVSAGATTYTSQRITGTPVGATPIQTPMRQTPIRGATGESAEEALAGQPQVVVIETTNSLLVNATAEQHTQIDMIIRYVDSEMLTEEIPYKLYPLENQPPDQIVKVLEKLIQDVVKDKEGKVEKIIKKEEGITVVPDPCTFSLIVYASKKNQDWIASLIKQLDKRRPQVLIDVTLVEISKTEDFNYDLNLISSIPDLTATSGLTGAITAGKTSTDIINSLASSKRDRFIDLQSNKGAGTGFYGDEHIQFLLTAMQQKNYGRVLAKPKILVNDNAKGSIKTTDTTYVAKRSSVPVSAGTAGQQTTLIETTLDYTGYPAGITLDITPHISEGDLLRLDIELTRSDFTTATGEKPPDTTESKINTVVTVPNSSTIILGGMLKLNQTKGGTKVPLLGDLPIIGAAFRTVSNSDLQRKLYVFVKAEVIRPADIVTAGKRDIDKISERNRLAFEQHESEFQDYQDMPGMKPKPTDPAKVLDAQ
jgi:general secretion pathway protein D